MTLATNIIAGTGYTPSSRLEGDTVRLKGVLKNNTGGTLSGVNTLATITAGHRPSIGLSVVCGNGNGSVANLFTIQTDGSIVSSVVIPAGIGIFLDGVTYTLS